VIATLAACLAAGIGAASGSSTTAHKTTAVAASEAEFDGSYQWYSRGDNNGGFQIGGKLVDLNKSNGYGVKFEVHVNGYTDNTYAAATDQDLTIPADVHYDPAATVTRYGYFQACQVNTYLPDHCSGFKQVSNPYAS
jgi:hypothetical protein